MAEDCTRAFGRYLRMLRDRRGLSLDEVCSLSQTFPEKITKGYLSRCENGRQKLAFAKVIPLSRIYEVPADVLVERMELDMELDRVGGPDTASEEFSELAAQARSAGERGEFWSQYALNRDAISLARTGEVSSSFRDEDEQHAMAILNCATAAKCLGRTSFALHEFRFVLSTSALTPKFESLALERVASTLRVRGAYETALEFSRRALQTAESVPDNELLGFIYSAHALILSDLQQFAESAKTYQRAYTELKQRGDLTGCVPILNSLCHVYMLDKNYRAARRSVEAALRLAKELNRERSEAISLIMLSELDKMAARTRSASEHLADAIRIAKQLNDRELRFKAELVLFERAIEDGNSPAIRAIHRRLVRLANWVPTHISELKRFRHLSKNLVTGSRPATR